MNKIPMAIFTCCSILAIVFIHLIAPATPSHSSAPKSMTGKPVPMANGANSTTI